MIQTLDNLVEIYDRMVGSCTAVMPMLLRQWKMENERFLVPEVASIRLSNRPKFCTDEFGARPNEFENWIACCHQKDLKLDKWASATMTAFEMVWRTPQMRAR